MHFEGFAHSHTWNLKWMNVAGIPLPAPDFRFGDSDSNCIPISFGRWISQVTPTYPLELPAVSACAFQEPWACRQRWSWDAFRLRSSLPCRGISDSRSCLPRVWPTRRTWHLEWNMCHLLRSDAWIIVSLWSLTPERWLRAMHLEFHLLQMISVTPSPFATQLLLTWSHQDFEEALRRVKEYGMMPTIHLVNKLGVPGAATIGSLLIVPLPISLDAKKHLWKHSLQKTS